MTDEELTKRFDKIEREIAANHQAAFILWIALIIMVVAMGSCRT